jgi:hypothetical protein
MQNLGYETIESYYIDAWNEGHSVYDTYDELLANAPGFGCGYTYLSLDADKLDDDNFMKNKWLNVQWFFERNGYHLYGVEWDTEFTTKTCYVVKLYYG